MSVQLQGGDFTRTSHHDIYPAIDATKSDLSQPSKVVLITGSGRGIGRSIALQYAHSGVASIIICARTISELDDSEKAIKEINSSVKVRKYTLDITDEAQVSVVAKAVTEEEGRLDILVNNAGIASERVPIAESDTEDYWKTWTVSIKGTYVVTKAFLPLLVDTAKTTKKADIVNISSVGAHRVTPGGSSYQISRLALLRFSEFIIAEYGTTGVNCIALHPGGILTELSKPVIEIRPFLVDTLELPGGFVVWYTKEQRSWLNGRYVSAQWDVDELEAKRDEIVEGDKLKVRLVL